MNTVSLIPNTTQPKIFNIKSELIFAQYSNNQNKIKYSWTFQGQFNRLKWYCNMLLMLPQNFRYIFAISSKTIVTPYIH